MAEKPTFTRREFLSSMAVVSTAVTVPTFIQRSAMAFGDPAARGLASRPGFPDDRILVVVELAGGNDGLNTVIPFGFDEYYRARPNLAVPAAEVNVLDQRAGIGLHPAMNPVMEMVEQGQASIIQGVGYPNPNRSHFASMDIWHTADPRGGQGLGWIGRAMDHAIGASGASGTDCICLGREAPLAAQAQHIKPISFESAELFRWTGAQEDESLAQAYDHINRAGVLEEAAAQQSNTPPRARLYRGQLVRTTPEAVESQSAFLMRTALDAQLASDRIRQAVARGTVTRFANGPLANQLRMVASMIRAELPTNVYYTVLGGFDTHASQAYRHQQLLTQFATGMDAFYKELREIKQDHRVLTVAFSEFGRRVDQNGSNGTDHGAAGPMFLFGPMVRPGLLGDHPSMSNLLAGDLAYTVDFRSIYAGILEGWFKTDSAKVLGGSFKPALLVKG